MWDRALKSLPVLPRKTTPNIPGLLILSTSTPLTCVVLFFQWYHYSSHRHQFDPSCPTLSCFPYWRIGLHWLKQWCYHRHYYYRQYWYWRLWHLVSSCRSLWYYLPTRRFRRRFPIRSKHTLALPRTKRTMSPC